MFSYNHFRSDLLPVVSSSDGGTVFGSQKNEWKMDGNIFVVEELRGNWLTDRLSFSAITYPASASTYPVSIQATNTNSSQVYTSTIISQTLGFSSTGIGSRTFTAPNTTTYQLATLYFSDTGTTISGSAQATGTTTGARTITQSNVTTLVPAALHESFNETRWYIMREHPFGNSPDGLRRVGLAYGLGEVGSSQGSRIASSLSASGPQSYNSTRFVLTSTSSVDTASNISFSETKIRKTIYATSLLGSGDASAYRRKFDGQAAFNTQGTSGSAMEKGIGQLLSPSISPDFQAFVQVADGVWFRRIFTNLESASDSGQYSIGASSASLRWSYLSSSWKMFATISNSSTSSTTEISMLTASAAATTSELAVKSVGISSCALGPLLPFSGSSLQNITISISATFNSSMPFAVFSGYGSTSSASSLSASYASGSSYSFSGGTGNSNLPFFVGCQGLSISTTSQSGYEVDESDATIFQNSKWNEAWRGDSVSVSQ